MRRFVMSAVAIVVMAIAAIAGEAKAIAREAIAGDAKAIAGEQAEVISLRQLHDMSNRMEHTAFHREALKHEALLKRTSADEWQQEIGREMPDSVSLLMQPTLYDIVMASYIQACSGNLRDSLCRVWDAYHQNDLLPGLYSRYIHSRGLATQVLCDAFDRMPQDHTQGYPLLLINMGRLSYQDTAAHRCISQYLSRYPNDSIAEPLRAMLRKIERGQVEYLSDRYIRTTDSIDLHLDITNCDTVICHLYPIPYNYTQRMAKLRHRSMDRIHPAWTDTIYCPEAKPFRTERDLRVGALPAGRYRLVVELPADTSEHEPWYRLGGSSLYVSDLTSFCFSGFEQGKKRARTTVVVASSVTGEPISGAKVKYSDLGIRLTNRNGEAHRRVNEWRYITYALHKGKHHRAKDNDQVLYCYRQQEEPANCYAANAKIFRPGDTLRLRVIGYEQGRGTRRLYSDQWLHYRIRDARWKAHSDSIIPLDPYGSAEIELPITPDMVTGTWAISTYYSKDSLPKHYNYYHTSDFFFTIEDYRMPALSLSFDASNRQQSKTSPRPLTGRVERTNGMPLSGHEVTISMQLVGSQENARLDTVVQTDGSGRFSLAFPDAWRPMLQQATYCRLRAVSLSADGEEVSDEQYIPFDRKGTEGPQPRHYTPADGFCPKDSLLWLPDEGIHAGHDSLSLILGMPYRAAVYEVVASRDREISRRWLHVDGLMRRSYPTPEGEDQYIDVLLYTIGKDGTILTAKKRINAPKKSAVRIVPVTFRDHLTPGSPEEWTFRLEDLDGTPRQGRIALTMFDEALLRWGYTYDSIHRPWNYPLYISSESQQSRISNSHSITLPQVRPYLFRRPRLYEPYGFSAEAGRIAGTVVDQQNEPIAGVGITVVGTTQGTVSDYDGHFSLEIEEGTWLEFRYLGMLPKVARAARGMVVTLEEGETVMDEVVVTGYGEREINLRLVRSSAPGNSDKVVVHGLGSMHSSGIYGARSNGMYGMASRKEVATYSLNVVDDAITMEEDYIEAEYEEIQGPTESASGSMPLRQGDTRLGLWRSGEETDADGRVTFRFTTPLDNTRWHLYMVAWTRDLRGGTLTTSLTAQRAMMARIGAPRFMREGDRLTMPLVFSNATDSAMAEVRYTASLIRRNATGDSVLVTQSGTLTIKAKGEAQAIFALPTATPAGEYVLRLTATLPDGTSDGEQRRVEVLPIAERVVEAASLLLGPNQNMATLHLPEMPADAKDAEMLHIRTGNPLQVLIDGLPTERDTLARTAFSLAHDLYSLAISNHIAERYPAYRKAIDLSPLIRDLEKYRTSGSFRWLADSRSTGSFYLTLHVMALLGELNVQGALPDDLRSVCEASVRYLDRTIVSRKRDWDKAHEKDTTARYDYTALLPYAYVRSHFLPTAATEAKAVLRELSKDAQPIFDSTIAALPSSLPEESLVTWPLVAITLHQAGQTETCERIVDGLRRYALTDGRQGMRWENIPDYCWWYRKSEVQANFLRAFRLAGATAEETLMLDRWMIVNNRLTDWGHSSLSAYCVSQLLSDTVLRLAPAPTRVDTIRMDAYKEGNHMARAMRMPEEQWAWSAVIRRYTAPATEVQPFGTEALRISRRYMVITSDTTTRPLGPDEMLSKGTHLRVVLTLETDREMDYVTIHDARPSALEPIGSSRYHYSAQPQPLFYYEEVRNTEETFYVEHLSQGTTEISYDTYVTFTGVSFAGLATATSDRAPEYSSHTGAAELLSN